MKIKKKKSTDYVIIAKEKGIWVRTAEKQKHEQAEKVIDGEDEDLVLCSLTKENKK